MNEWVTHDVLTSAISSVLISCLLLYLIVQCNIYSEASTIDRQVLPPIMSTNAIYIHEITFIHRTVSCVNIFAKKLVAPLDDSLYKTCSLEHIWSNRVIIIQRM